MTSIRRLGDIVFWLIAPLVCLAIYWPGLIAWFQQDDFAWLMLLREVREGRSLLSALFTPQAQGSIRPLGERAYYLGLNALFGFDPLPFRILAFLVQFGSLALVVRILRRMTGSKAAGLAAALFWTASAVLCIVMTWSAEFMLILCGFFLLLALDRFQRYAETGARRYLAGCWAAFLIGFGALESNAVFPLLAASWALLFARKYIWKTVPMFAVSAVYTVVHMVVAPNPKDSVYTIKIGWHMLRTLKTYWVLSVLPEGFEEFFFSAPLAHLLAVLITAATAAFVVYEWRRGRREAVWFLAWYFITLLPVLPLPRHISSYYLTLPSLGIAMLAGYAMVRAWRSGWAARSAAGVLAAAFLVVQVPVAHGGCKWWSERSIRGRRWIAHVQAARQRHPGKSIVYQGFQTEVYYNVVTNAALNLIDGHDVWLSPDTVRAMGDLDSTAEYIKTLTIAPDLARRLFEQGSLAAYSVGESEILEIRKPKDLDPELRAVAPVFSLDLGRPESEFRVAKGWHQPESGDRWMSPRSVTILSCADKTASEIYLKGRVPAALLTRGPATLKVTLAGQTVGTAVLFRPESTFDLSFPLPHGVPGSERLELLLECDRSFRSPPDERDLSLLFGLIGVRRAPGGVKP